MIIPEWDTGNAYNEGEYVQYQAKLYVKDSSGQQGNPELEGWVELDPINLQQYNNIAARLDSYESRVVARQAIRASAKNKLIAFGLSAAEIDTIVEG